MHQPLFEADYPASPPKKMKLCQPPVDPVISFGWHDFPLIMEPSSPLSSSKLPLTTFDAEYYQDQDVPHMIEASDDSDEDIIIDVDISGHCDVVVEVENQRTTRRRVQFDTVQVQEHGLTLGDHPWADSYPLSIDWSHLPPRTMSIDDFEESRNRRPANRTFHHPFRMPEFERRMRLETVTGLSSFELAGLERRRQVQAEREAMMRTPVDTDDEKPEMEQTKPLASDSQLVTRMLRNPSIVDLGRNFLEMDLTDSSRLYR